MSKQKINGLSEFVAALGSYCDERSSGTVYFNSDDSGSARLVLENGRIISVTYKQYSGMEAIDELKHITIGQVSFISGMVLKSGGAQALPDSDNILRVLAKGPSPVQTTSDKATDTDIIQAKEIPQSVSDPVQEQPLEAEQEITSSGTDFLRDDVVDVLTEEAMEYLGPIASRLCDNYLPKSVIGLSKANVIDVMNQLAEDISESDSRDLFKDQVQNRLELS